MRFTYTAAFLLCTTLAAPVMAQNLDTGVDAHAAGDYATALENWRPLAEQGNADAQVYLGSMYEFGQGVPQDYAEAASWYRKAAEQGQTLAQVFLGYLYTIGKGVLRDDVLAHMWYNIAGANGEGLGSENRAKTEQRMTREQIADAQARALVCTSSNYQDCD